MGTIKKKTEIKKTIDIYLKFWRSNLNVAKKPEDSCRSEMCDKNVILPPLLNNLLKLHWSSLNMHRKIRNSLNYKFHRFCVAMFKINKIKKFMTFEIN